MNEHFDHGLRAAMRAAFPSYDERLLPLYGMVEYHLGWRDERLQPHDFGSGKLIRPRLCLLACRAIGGNPDRALPLAAAIQLVHDFTLVHDDIQDRSDLRRGRPTVWRLWGEAQGINAGDALFALSHLALARLSDAGVQHDVVLAVLRRFDETILRICEGQYLDLSFEERLDLSEADYLTMIERKTAVLLAAALELGALVGGGSAAAAEALRHYGLALGLAFQMQDDLLGIWGDPKRTGKPFAADLYRRKKSLPVIYALSHAQPDDQSLLRSLYSRDELGPDDVAALLEILDRFGARRYVEEAAVRYHADALAALDRVQDGNAEALAELRSLAQSLLGRSG